MLIAAVCDRLRMCMPKTPAYIYICYIPSIHILHDFSTSKLHHIKEEVSYPPARSIDETLR